LKNIGRYDEALVYYQKADHSILHDKNPDLYALILENTGNLYLKKHEYEKALSNYLDCIEFRDKRNLKPVPRNFSNLAYCQSVLQLNHDAEINFKKAISLYQKDYAADSIGLARVYSKFGKHYLSNNVYNKAKKYLNATLAIHLNVLGEKHSITAKSYSLLADYYKETGELEKAIAYCDHALAAFDDQMLKPALNQFTYLQLLAKKAGLQDAQYTKTNNEDYLVKSNALYAQAVDLLNRYKSTFYSENSRLNFIENQQKIILDALHVAGKLYQQTNNESYLSQAFYYAEMSKAAVLNSLLYEAGALNKANIPDSLLRYEKELNAKITYLENKTIYQDDVQPDTEQYSRLINLYREREQLISNFESNFKDYYRLKYTNPEIDLHSIAQHMQPNEALVEYVLTDNLLYTFYLSGEQKGMITNAIDYSFFDELFYLHSFIKFNPHISYTSDHFERYKSTAWSVYEKVLKPLEEQIAGKKIIVIPDAELNYIPFEALLTAYDKDDYNYAMLPYLVKEHAVSYQYSATTLNLLDNNKPVSARNAVSFTPVYSQNSADDASLTRDGYDFLKGALNEVETIARLVKLTQFAGELATESNFKENANKYGIIHLAMHAQVNEENPLFSNLAFANEKDEDNDGKLNTYELYNMDFNPELLVLSACNTGSGKLQKGEGFMSIARGFIHAGCKSLLMTLWEVNDKSGQKLMSSFYHNLNLGIARDEALQKAKMEYFTATEPLKVHPYYWASYVNIGENTSVSLRKNHANATSIVPILALLILIPLLIHSIFSKLKN
jgi:CHAT domain-containing protein